MQPEDQLDVNLRALRDAVRRRSAEPPLRTGLPAEPRDGGSVRNVSRLDPERMTKPAESSRGFLARLFGLGK